MKQFDGSTDQVPKQVLFELVDEEDDDLEANNALQDNMFGTIFLEHASGDPFEIYKLEKKDYCVDEIDSEDFGTAGDRRFLVSTCK